jgi:hypothetical protein
MTSESGGFGRRYGEPCHFDMVPVQVQVPTSYYLRTVPVPIQNPVPCIIYENFKFRKKFLSLRFLLKLY